MTLILVTTGTTAKAIFICLLLLLICSGRQGLAQLNGPIICDKSQVCLRKPLGCNPTHDCTLFVSFSVDGDNSLHIQMSAQTLIPAVPLQYMAIGFSHDQEMVKKFLLKILFILSCAG